MQRRRRERRDDGNGRSSKGVAAGRGKQAVLPRGRREGGLAGRGGVAQNEAKVIRRKVGTLWKEGYFGGDTFCGQGKWLGNGEAVWAKGEGIHCGHCDDKTIRS